jgi:MFS family permease
MKDPASQDDVSTPPRDPAQRDDAAVMATKEKDGMVTGTPAHNVEVQDIDPALDRQITRKLDRHLLPWLFGIWLFAFIDRSNIGNAKIDGIVPDLHLTGNRFNIALTVFYVPYILVNVPSNWILKHIGAGLYLPTLITCWGLVSCFMGLTKSYAGLIVCRLLLGFFEGGLFCGMILYLSMFYRRHQLLFRLALWYCAAPLSGAIGGLLAAGLSRIRYQGYNRWPWIFVVEGAITTVYGLITFIMLPDTPAQTKFLSQELKDAAVLRLRHDALGSQADSKVDLEKFDWRWVRMAAVNINTMLDSLNFLFILVPYVSPEPHFNSFCLPPRIYSYSLFLPTIITGLGYTDVIAQLFTVPPNVVGFLFVLGVAYVSDRTKMRGVFLLSGALLAIIGYIMLLVATSPSVRYGG